MRAFTTVKPIPTEGIYVILGGYECNLVEVTGIEPVSKKAVERATTSVVYVLRFNSNPAHKQAKEKRVVKSFAK